ncbi:trigger factor [Psychromonas sp. psych-6C06]|uniref:trigger factor n=1 Tax=Psychromonas sp. psych-6C06 TaxID=2058089 RepID=UPI000C336ECF|nr:trigger factor [Psychromonas sp. psych-6C06]PKF63593.1 trigger factor [Psychromonas sp. psych-6C06]
MQVSVEASQGLERTLTISVAAEVFEKEFDGRIRQLSKTQRVDGFRPGKVPASVITKRFGAAVENEVAGEVMQRNFFEAVVAEKLNPAGAPKVEPKARKKGEEFVFTATFEVYPEVTLSELSELSVEKETAEVSDADLDKMIETLRKQHATWSEVETEAADGNQVTVDFEGSVDGEVFEGGKAEGFQIVIGSGRMIPGFESGIEGNKAGSEFTIDVNFPEEYHAENLKGKAAQFAIKLTKVEEQILPEITEEFVKKFGVESGDIEALKADVKQNMQRELTQVLKNNAKDVVLTALVEGNEIEVPKSLVEGEVNVLRKQAMERYAQQMDPKNLPELPAELFTEQAEKRVKVGLLLGEVIKTNELKVDQDKVASLIESAASAYENPAEVIEYYKNNKEMMQNMENVALEEQAVDFIIEKAKVNEVNKSFDEVMNKTVA